MRDVNAKLVIIGNRPELENLKEFANKEHVRNKIKFKQNLSIEQLYKELCTSTALIMPSAREGLSLISRGIGAWCACCCCKYHYATQGGKTLCSEVEEGLLNDMLEIGRNTKRSTKKKEGSEHVFK